MRPGVGLFFTATSLCTISQLTYFLVSYSHIHVFIDNDANVWNRALAARFQMNTLIRWSCLNAECHRAFCPRLWRVCVSEIKQKGKTKWHQVGVYPSMVGLWVCPLLTDKNCLITHTNIWNSAWGKNGIIYIYTHKHIYTYVLLTTREKNLWVGDIQAYKCPPQRTFAVFLILSYYKYVDKHRMLQCRVCWRVWLWVAVVFPLISTSESWVMGCLRRNCQNDAADSACTTAVKQFHILKVTFCSTGKIAGRFMFWQTSSAGVGQSANLYYTTSIIHPCRCSKVDPYTVLLLENWYHFIQWDLDSW